MIIREEYLVIINSKNRIQRICLQLDQIEFGKKFGIYRITGQYGGKETHQPEIIIDKGKVRRTVIEQATLQFNSYLKSYMDKGYCRLQALTDKKYQNLSEEEIKDLLGDGFASDQAGIPKPMLAKQIDQCSPNIFEKKWFCSIKLNGVRCLMYYKNGEIHTASRGGGNYDISTAHLRTNPDLIKIFEDNPDLILDGELYIHSTDYPLQKISGLARLQEWNEECKNLEYWIYDYISNNPFKLRYSQLMKMREKLTTNNIKIINHTLLSGYLVIKKEHDKYVRAGFEGLCARNPDKEYGVNKRSSIYLLKMKEYKDREDIIVGYEEGLRPEDMVFIMQMPNGKKYKAKPTGPAINKIEYIKNIKDYIGKQATIKFFEYSSDGTPLQPVLLHFRPKDE